MKVLRSPLKELGSYDEIRSALKKQQSVLLTGCIDAQKLHIVDGICDDYEQRVIAVYSEQKARELYEDVLFYDKTAVYYPTKDLMFYQADIRGRRLITERLRAVRTILEGGPCTIVTTFDALMSRQVPLREYKNHMLRVDKGAMLEQGTLARRLVALGYEKQYQVDAPGQFSIRGDIIDIFDLTEENPYRIELWGDEVESIRSFDVESQRSIEELGRVIIFPACEMILDDDRLHAGMDRIAEDAKRVEESLRAAFQTEEAHRIKLQADSLREQVYEFHSMANLDSYMEYFYPAAGTFLELFDPTKLCVVLEEPMRLKEHAEAVETEFRESMIHRAEKGYLLPGQMHVLRSVEETMAELEQYHLLGIATMDCRNFPIRFDYRTDVTVSSVAPYNNSFETLVKDLSRYRKQGYRVLLLSGSRTRAKRLAEDLMDQDILAFYSEDGDRELQPGEIMTFYGHMSRGFEYPMIRFVVITETDIFGAKKKKPRRRRFSEGTKISRFDDLKVGDYVVHETYGLGIYQGIEKVEKERIVRDYMKIVYRDGGILYVPATGLDVIQKYASADTAKVPKLNKLGTQEWTKTKTRVRTAVSEVAKDLVELYAKRQQQQGFVFSKDNLWQREFEELFPFEETQDQLMAIEATKSDMESPKIMDRLICGDVGYGKTEIAIRAAFKAVQDGKQVAFLVPTTILAQQHYNTFTQRMKNYPITIDLLCRFRSAAEQKKTVERMKKGEADIVIGTHRMLSADVGFKDLGLLIIDEEQRFGVSHKEKIKKLRENVDVLTLTATPIPRTLHMSLAGIRDMSVLEEAPEDRLPIQTYVMEYNEEMVREAIERELSRNGQVYYVYNGVSGIADMTARIQMMIPDAVVCYAHGQMKETELEQIMYEFINGEIDVLVATTIIETGLDISNVNTIIIHDSDNMGLSQLYQLRGRVGRSARTSYAFLMYKRDKILREVAEKRLQAIREFTELGSGFKIAMRDLEIRGAGNILGTTQHGHMEAVGYDLYCKMLNEAVKNLRGIETREDYPTLVDIDVNAYIPPDYIMNEVQKLEIYKRIAGVETQAECDDMTEELLDRFGEVPRSAANLMRISLLRVEAHRLYITELKGKNEHIVVQMYPTAPVLVEKIPEFLHRYGNRITMNTKGAPQFILRYDKAGIVEKDEEILMSTIRELLDTMKILYDD
ncbi:MAG: transcription-repair coupling factor [Lachnospiraceae bacterium]